MKHICLIGLTNCVAPTELILIVHFLLQRYRSYGAELLYNKHIKINKILRDI